jgi:hypothetical protein
MKEEDMADQKSAVTVIFNEQPVSIDRALIRGSALYLDKSEMAQKLGWEIKPEGACFGESCYRVPRNLSIKEGSADYFDFTGLAEVLNKPWAGDQSNRVWYFGTEAAARVDALKTLKAPNFTLPDIDGRMHSLSDHLGKKVFLVSWASW